MRHHLARHPRRRCRRRCGLSVLEGNPHLPGANVIFVELVLVEPVRRPRSAESLPMVTSRHHNRVFQQPTLPHPLNHPPHHPIGIANRMVVLFLPILRPVEPPDFRMVSLKISGDHVRVVGTTREDGHKHWGLHLLTIDPLKCLVQRLLIPGPPRGKLVLLLPLRGGGCTVEELLDPQLLPQEVQLLEAKTPRGKQCGAVPCGVEEARDGDPAERVGNLGKNGPLSTGVPPRNHGQNPTKRGRKSRIDPREGHRLGLKARQHWSTGSIYGAVRSQQIQRANPLVKKQKHVGLGATEAG
mmetsp:Transcript_46426/g.105351  ORF Transcript_46426/g.105351 Transcript_46426/m.105351 type:complete len:298 (-) Transcript_46426:577-1470(-)